MGFGTNPRDEEYERWLQEQAASNPSFMQRPPDMSFTVDEAENAPDMTISPDEARRGPFTPDMSFAPQRPVSDTDRRVMGALVNEQRNQRQSNATVAPLMAASQQGPGMRAAQPNPWQVYGNEEDQGRQQPQGQTQQPTSSLPQSGGLSSLMRPRDVEMDERWRGAENAALDQSGFGTPQKYGVGEAVRDFAPLAVGGTLDILLNKGRDIAPLAGAAMQANAAQDKLRATQAQNAGEFARGARTQREGNRLSNVRAVSEERQQQQYDLMNNPDHPQAKARVAQLVAAGVPAEMVEGQPLRVLQSSNALYTPYFRHKTADITNEDAAGRAGGVKDAQHASDDKHFDTELGQKVRVAGDTAAASAGATQDVTHMNAPRATMDEVSKRLALEDAGVGSGSGMGGHVKAEDVIAANPGLDFGDAKYLQDALRTRSLTKDVIEKITGANRGTEVIDRLHDAADAFQEAASNGDIKGAWNARRLYNSHAEEFAGAMEAITGNKSDSAKAGFMKLVPSLADPTAPEGVKQLWSAIEANTQSNLGTYHIRPRTPRSLGGDEPPQPTAAAPAAGADMDFAAPSTQAPGQSFNVAGPKRGDNPKAKDYLNGVNPGGDTLGTTGQPRGKVPMVPVAPGQARSGAAGGGAAAAPRMRIIEDTKTGETESEMMTDDEVRAFMQGNPGVQVR